MREYKPKPEERTGGGRGEQVTKILHTYLAKNKVTTSGIGFNHTTKAMKYPSKSLNPFENKNRTNSKMVIFLEKEYIRNVFENTKN